MFLAFSPPAHVITIIELSVPQAFRFDINSVSQLKLHTKDKNLKAWIVTSLLATLISAIPVLSVAESFGSEEAKVEITELAEFKAGEEKIVENRRRRIQRRSIVCRRQDTGQLPRPSHAEVASMPLRLRSKHNGCGSHLRV